MKKTIYVLILPLVVVSGLLFASCEIKNETKLAQKPLSIAKKKTGMDEKKKWEASPDGINYKKWQVSPAGKKVRDSYSKIEKHIKAFTDMDAVVTSTTFQRTGAKSSGPKWLVVRIDGEEYMMQFSPKDFQQLNSLKVNDKITVKSRSASCSPNHPYLIISSDYIALNNEILFKREINKNNGC